MANRERGEVELVVDGTSYTLKLSTNVAVSVETRLNKKIGDILVDAGALSFKSFRTLMWLLLQKYHASEFKSEDSVGEFIDRAGGLGGLLLKLKEIADVNRPEGEAADNGNPPAAQDVTGGTGEPSTSAPDESA